jgi:hypothetical protein
VALTGAFADVKRRPWWVIVAGTAATAADAIMSALAAEAVEAISRRIRFFLIQAPNGPKEARG